MKRPHNHNKNTIQKITQSLQYYQQPKLQTMSDPFRRLFLDQVDIIIKKDPSREVLLTLLQLATPGLGELLKKVTQDMHKNLSNTLIVSFLYMLFNI